MTEDDFLSGLKENLFRLSDEDLKTVRTVLDAEMKRRIPDCPKCGAYGPENCVREGKQNGKPKIYCGVCKRHSVINKEP
jgi:Pyruvate/2-oxoacid:ferredoxin oxidoreductase delta subunit